MSKKFSGVTLMELIIAIVLLSIVVIGLANIDVFSHYHVMAAERRAKLQHEASFALEHMSKEISRAIGNEIINGQNTLAEVIINPNDSMIKIYIDASGNGRWEPDPGNNPPASVDHWIAYRLDTTGAADIRNRIRYCGRCRNSNCNFNQCLDGADGEIISTNITNFTPIKPSNPLTENYITVQITACWDPTVAQSIDNPCVNMNTTIKMPSVSTH